MVPPTSARTPPFSPVAVESSGMSPWKPASSGVSLTVKETPEEAGFHGLIPDDSTATPENAGVRAEIGQVIRAILTNPVVWITACAYACTGAVRQAVDQWFPRYMQELYQADLNSAQFKF